MKAHCYVIVLIFLFCDDLPTLSTVRSTFGYQLILLHHPVVLNSRLFLSTTTRVIRQINNFLEAQLGSQEK